MASHPTACLYSFTVGINVFDIGNVLLRVKAQSANASDDVMTMFGMMMMMMKTVMMAMTNIA